MAGPGSVSPRSCWLTRGRTGTCGPRTSQCRRAPAAHRPASAAGLAAGQSRAGGVPAVQVLAGLEHAVAVTMPAVGGTAVIWRPARALEPHPEAADAARGVGAEDVVGEPDVRD